MESAAQMRSGVRGGVLSLRLRGGLDFARLHQPFDLVAQRLLIQTPSFPFYINAALQTAFSPCAS